MHGTSRRLRAAQGVTGWSPGAAPATGSGRLVYPDKPRVARTWPQLFTSGAAWLVYPDKPGVVRAWAQPFTSASDDVVYPDKPVQS